MKKTFTLAVVAWLLTVTGAPGADEITSDEQKFSYAVGFQIGQNLSREGLKLDAEVLSQAIKDAVAGSDPKLTPDDMRAAVEQYRQRAAEKLAAEAHVNLKAGEAFMDENKGKPDVIQTASGLQYKVLKEGSGKQPTESDTVVVHYRGTLLNGDEFDSSYSREQPATLPLNGVIKGWQEALPQMSVGAKWELYIPPDLAYGERGAGSRIGPNQALIFEVELLEVK
ncbi:MAG: FKBP-type peptidyl-prolyl cis-trans isomerase [Gammaproteobacteria bacterium]|nr:FKBP-type peptidyl-prolyl cis-trans isomerase [Gammaproteobacteria bacterium]